MSVHSVHNSQGYIHSELGIKDLTLQAQAIEFGSELIANVFNRDRYSQESAYDLVDKFLSTPKKRWTSQMLGQLLGFAHKDEKVAYLNVALSTVKKPNAIQSAFGDGKLALLQRMISSVSSFKQSNPNTKALVIEPTKATITDHVTKKALVLRLHNSTVNIAEKTIRE